MLFFKDCWPWKGDVGATEGKRDTAPAREKGGVGFSSAWYLDQPHVGRLGPERDSISPGEDACLEGW